MNSRKLNLIMIICFLGSFVFMSKFHNIITSTILMFATIILFNYQDWKYAVHSVRYCTKFLLFNTVCLGIMIALLIVTTGFVEDNSLNLIIVFIASYFLIWLIVIYTVDNRVAKLSTMIIGQGITILYLFGSYILNILPNETIMRLSIDFKLLGQYGYSPKDIISISMQTIFYPALGIALLTYVITELKEYWHDKYRSS
jgi:hypothetical protein